jgi:hypothetical protein
MTVLDGTTMTVLGGVGLDGTALTVPDGVGLVGTTMTVLEAAVLEAASTAQRGGG